MMARGANAASNVQYRLPVSGSWRVGGSHAGAKNDQAYALDLVVGGRAGLTLAPPKNLIAEKGNAAWPSYGQTIVADAPGVIAIAVDGIPENAPGVMNGYDMHGNYIVIDHENGEYSLMAHFIPGSLKVRPGQRVVAGTPLALCGNSGNSTSPHLHWQVMDHVNAHQAHGVVPRLLPYTRNGATSVDYPQPGDFVVGP